ncbi:MAG: tetratricopeptide repeat protein [Candidatus Obscuribacterales bacterium]|nr:tetratricopeptide repeat protein [Candidatus Obscuribacterales bacterium]
MTSRFLILTSCLISLLSVGQNAALATKINARPLPSERELKDFENSQSSAPTVSRFSRRMDYREQEKAQKEQAEAARLQAIERAAQAEKAAIASSKKVIQEALEANNRGVALGKQGRWTEAIQAHERAVQLEPQNKQYRINLSAARCTFGQARMAAKDYDAAAGLFRKALAAAPDNGLAAKNLNEVMKKQGHDPGSVEERVSIGDQLLAVHDMESALIEYQTALQMENSARTHTKMGDVALHNGQLSTAANWYRSALEKDANFGKAHRQLGMVQLQASDMTGAAASLRKAIILDSKDNVAGQTLVEIWRRQVAQNPLLAENHLGLAGALQLTGDFNAAEDEYNKLATLEPGNPGLSAGRASLARARQHAMAEKHRAAAETLFNQGLKREALAEIGQSVMMEPKNARYQFLLGECLEANGDLRGAHQAYMTCVLIDPEKNQEAAFRMKEMQRGNTLNAPVQQAAQPQYPQAQAAPMQQAMQPQAPFQKNVFEAGSGMQVAKTQMGFSTHDEAQQAPAQNMAPTQVSAQVPAQSPVAQTPDPNAELMARVTEFERNRNYEGAAAFLKEVCTQNLQNPDLHHRLAVDLLAAGNVTEAIAEFRIASALRPGNKEFAGDLARAMEIHKRSQENAFEEAVPSASGKEVAAK